MHTSPLQGNQGRITMTPEMLNLQWEKTSLYPTGHCVRQIEVQPTVTFPEDWHVFTALDGQRQSGARVTWAPTDYETLVDSPVFAGKHAQSWDLATTSVSRRWRTSRACSGSRPSICRHTAILSTRR